MSDPNWQRLGQSLSWQRQREDRHGRSAYVARTHLWGVEKVEVGGLKIKKAKRAVVSNATVQ